MYRAIILLSVVISCTVGRQILTRSEVDDNKIQPYHLPANATAIRSLITYSFTCKGRSFGYYADVENDCQIFHICSGSTQSSFVCPNNTRFNQEIQVCVHMGTMANPCEDSEKYYPSGLDGSTDETDPGYGDAENTENAENGGGGTTTTEAAEESSTTNANEEEAAAAATTVRSGPVDEESVTTQKNENEGESATAKSDNPEESATLKSANPEEAPVPGETAAEPVASDDSPKQAEEPAAADIPVAEESAEAEKAALVLADDDAPYKEAALDSDAEPDTTLDHNDIQFEKTNAHHKYARKSFLFKADAITSH